MAKNVVVTQAMIDDLVGKKAAAKPGSLGHMLSTQLEREQTNTPYVTGVTHNPITGWSGTPTYYQSPAKPAAAPAPVAPKPVAVAPKPAAGAGAATAADLIKQGNQPINPMDMSALISSIRSRFQGDQALQPIMPAMPGAASGGIGMLGMPQIQAALARKAQAVPQV